MGLTAFVPLVILLCFAYLTIAAYIKLCKISKTLQDIAADMKRVAYGDPNEIKSVRLKVRPRKL